MARHQDGSLIPRSHRTQKTFDRNISKITDNWGVGPILAIPNVRGLRPMDLAELGVDSVRLLASISKLKTNLAAVREDLIAERDSRIRSKPAKCASDRTLKPADLKKIFNKYQSLNDTASPKVVHEEVEFLLITLGSKPPMNVSTRQRPALPASDASDSESRSPQTLTRLRRKRKHDWGITSPSPTAKEFRPADINEALERPREEGSVSQRSQLKANSQKYTEQAEINLATHVKEASSLRARNSTRRKLNKESEERAHAALEVAISDSSSVNGSSISIWHQYIDTDRSAPKINPVRLEIDNLRTNCGDMMFFIEGAARSYKQRPLTEPQKDALAYDSEVCEVALKSILDAYLKKLEDADIIPRISDNPISSTQATITDDDVKRDAGVVDLANSTAAVTAPTQRVPIFNESGPSAIQLPPRAHRPQVHAVLQGASNDTDTPQANATMDALLH